MRRLFPGCENKWWNNCVFLPTESKQNATFSPGFTQPGKSLLEIPCKFNLPRNHIYPLVVTTIDNFLDRGWIQSNSSKHICYWMWGNQHISGVEFCLPNPDNLPNNRANSSKLLPQLFSPNRSSYHGCWERKSPPAMQLIMYLTLSNSIWLKY